MVVVKLEVSEIKVISFMLRLFPVTIDTGSDCVAARSAPIGGSSSTSTICRTMSTKEVPLR